MTRVSVVVRTYNEERHLARTLQAILDQRDVEPEIIVVDSGSTDDTVAIAERFPVKLVQLSQREFSYGRALNLGFAAAGSDFVACLSAHALPLDCHWLRNLVRPLADPLVDGVVGKTLPHPDCNPFDRRGLLRQYPTGPRYLFDGKLPGFANANSAVRRAAWQAEPFDETLPYSEDVLWARRRLGAGRLLVYAADAACYHSHNETPAQLLRRFRGEALAREMIDPHARRYRLTALVWDAVAGTGYDWATLLRSRAPARWWPFALRRRVAINLGRFAGSRGIEPTASGRLLPRLIERIGLRFVRLGGSVAGRLAPRVVVLTRKHARPLHPKHLLGQTRDHFWYADELAGGARVLDVGCNVGAHTNFAAQQGLAVIGMDIDPAALSHARFVLGWERAQNAMVMRADANAAFPFAAAVFDRVLAFDVIEHLDDPAHLLAEIRRVLAPGGVLLLTAPNADTPFKRRLRRAGLPFFADVTHQVEYTRAGIEAELAAGGFAVRRDEPIVADTPWAPWFDLAGAFSLALYRRLATRKRAAALRDPAVSTGFRLVAQKVGD
jgi:glycosyltransferase involved in cell wall biosynthesis/SAM-dependent methyltransferase